MIISQMQTLRGKMQENPESATGLAIKVTLVEPKTIERSEGKTKPATEKRKF
jgi:phenylacetate-CoA ligase